MAKKMTLLGDHLYEPRSRKLEMNDEPAPAAALNFEAPASVAASSAVETSSIEETATKPGRFARLRRFMGRDTTAAVEAVTAAPVAPRQAAVVSGNFTSGSRETYGTLGYPHKRASHGWF